MGISQYAKGKLIASLEGHLNSIGGSLARIGPLKHLLGCFGNDTRHRTVKPEIEYDDIERLSFFESYLAARKQMNLAQQNAIDSMTRAYDQNGVSKVFVLMAAAGTGKTFVQNALIMVWAPAQVQLDDHAF